MTVMRMTIVGGRFWAGTIILLLEVGIIFYLHLSILYAMQFLPLLVINAKAAMIETGDRQA